MVNKTEILIGVIIALLAASGIGAVAGVSIAASGASCGAIFSTLTLIQKGYSSCGKIYHMVYTFASEPAASLQEGLLRTLTNGELAANEFKLLEFVYHDFLRHVDKKVQKKTSSSTRR